MNYLVAVVPFGLALMAGGCCSCLFEALFESIDDGTIAGVVFNLGAILCVAPVAVSLLVLSWYVAVVWS